jgi:hypothetical protein
MTHSDITGMLDHERRREMLAAADRRRLTSLVRREARAAKRGRAGSLATIPLRADVRG